MKTTAILFSMALTLASCGATETTLSSSDLASAVREEIMTFSGTLRHVAAIGGETSGFALVSDAGTTELDLATRGLQSQFVEGKMVSVTGHMEQRTGVETGVRQVLVVESMRDITSIEGESIPTPNTNTIQVNGPVAEKIIDALVATEITKSPIGGGFQVQLKNLKCDHTPRGFIYAQCTFTDLSGRGLTLHPITQKALDIKSALEAAGVRSREHAMGTFVKVKTLTCTRGGFVAGNNCVIKISNWPT